MLRVSPSYDVFDVVAGCDVVFDLVEV